jgi:hypothetical protein
MFHKGRAKVHGHQALIFFKAYSNCVLNRLSRARLITTTKCLPLASFSTMLAAENYPEVCTASPSTHELLEIHRSKISLHHAKPGYDYPSIRLPFTFSGLIGLPTRIYRTVHDGTLAFLVVVSSASESSPDKHENALSSAESIAFTRRRSCVRITPSPSVFFRFGDSQAQLYSSFF